MCGVQDGNQIGDEGAKAIAQALTRNSSVGTLLLVRFDLFFCLCCVCRACCVGVVLED
jgi:hypothetical protein